MKRIKLLLATLCLLSSAILTIAQENNYVDIKLEKLKTELNLNAEQETKLRDLFSTNFEQAKIDIEKHDGDKKELVKLFQARKEENNKKIKTILSDEQFEKYMDYQKKRTAEMSALILQRKLQLTDEQTEKIVPIMSESQTKLKEVRENSGDSRRAKMKMLREMKSITDEQDDELEEILTDEQNELYEKIKEERKTKFKAQLNSRK